MKYVTVIILLVATVRCSKAVDKPNYELEQAEVYFNNFINKYNKSYGSDEERQQRLEIFRENLKKINAHNKNFEAIFGINAFADLTTEELNSFMGLNVELGEGQQNDCKIVSDQDVVGNDAPPELDWRTQGLVSAVKNQGRCGACWAFSTIANIEGQYARKTGQMQTFSPQQLVDCDHPSGCKGGFMPVALSNIIKNGGVQSDADYPYVSKETSCRFDPSKAKVTLSSCNNYMLQDENKLKQVLHDVGPLSIALHAGSFQDYQGGILDNCPQEAQNHAVLLVGYGSENGRDYWLIKNSWGESWGEAGYIRIPFGVNACNLMSDLTCTAVL